MEMVHKNGHDFNISTITLICDLDKEQLNIKAISDNFNEDNMRIKPCKRNKEFEVTKRGKIKKSFFNQVTINFEDISKKSIKIFLNGKLQITGLTSMYECEHVSQMILNMLRKYLNIDVNIKKMRIGMINSNFAVDYDIDLISLNVILNHRYKFLSIYNPESYPAINMKIHKIGYDISIFIFRTGNIVITSGRSLNDMQNAYTMILKILEENEHVKTKKEKMKTKKYQNKIQDGYYMRQYLSCCY